MVELIEYVLILGVSAGLATASVMLVNGAMPGLSRVAAASKSDQLAGAARIAIVEDRNVTVLLPLDGSSVGCAGGSLSVSIDGDQRVYELGFPCSFDYQGLDGACTFIFSVPAQSLQLEVAC